MKPDIPAHIKTLRAYQLWRTGKDGRTAGEAGIVPRDITVALDAVLDFAERATGAGDMQPSADAARYRTLRAMPPGIRIQVHIGDGEYEEILSGDELDIVVGSARAFAP